MLEDGVHSLAYGHKQITVLGADDEEEEAPNEIVLSAAEAARRRVRVQDKADFPEGQEPQAAAAEAQVLRHLTVQRPHAAAPANDVSHHIIFFARYNRILEPTFQGLSAHHVRALTALARYELNRKTPDGEIRRTLDAIIASLREVDPVPAAASHAREVAPLNDIFEYLNLD